MQRRTFISGFLKGLCLSVAVLSSMNRPAIAQETKLEGAWQTQVEGKEVVLLFQDGYFTETQYTTDTFLFSTGGPYVWRDDALVITNEFHSKNADAVGQKRTLIIRWDKDKLQVQSEGREAAYTRLDEGKGALAGVWKISERMQDGKLTPIHQSGTRKTLKMLTGTRFQWFAIDPAAKSFSGTGGGTYTFESGVYTENIEFFSRDNTRAGSRLSFEGAVKNDEWHHKGLSSKGAPIYEVWTNAMDL